MAESIMEQKEQEKTYIEAKVAKRLEVVDDFIRNFLIKH